MSKISEIVIRHITRYNNVKIRKWDKPEPPPKQMFDIQEIYIIGNAIISELEGMISDNFLIRGK